MKHKILILAVVVFCSACSRETPTWVPMWKDTSPLITARSSAAAIVHNGFIYVIGGVDGRNFLKTTEYAKIRADGSLSPWKQGPSMNEARGFADAVVYKDTIYIVGGANGPYGKNLLRSVERSKILPDGSLSSWIDEKHNMNMPRRCSKVVLVGNRLFSLGGFGGDMLNTVEHAEILDNGAVGEWLEEGEKLTVLRYISGVKKEGEAAYVVGGHHQMEGVGIQDVEWSKVVDEAGFQEWKRTSPLQVGRYGLTTVVHDGNIYALGGITGTEYLDSVEKSKISATGELEPWRLTTPLSLPRAMLSAVVYKDRVYILGGTNQDGYMRSVEYATFNEDGDIGFWGNEEDAASIRSKKEQKAKKSNGPLPNEGTVLKTLQAKRYVYILVSKGEERIWLAGPKMELHAGDRISYSKGVYMSNFYSKELKMNFPSVIFVGKVRKL